LLSSNCSRQRWSSSRISSRFISSMVGMVPLSAEVLERED
jgi:hypothetical protein